MTPTQRTAMIATVSRIIRAYENELKTETRPKWVKKLTSDLAAAKAHLARLEA